MKTRVFDDLGGLEARLRAAFAEGLPGLEAQLRMAPRPSRPDWRPAPPPADARPAAGLLLLYPSPTGIHLPLTVRADGLRHGGQVSLPGGAVDPDEAIEVAALREAAEEIGLDPSGARVLGGLTPVHVAVSGFVLHPVVGLARAQPALRPDRREVARILEIPLAALLDAPRLGRGTLERDGVIIEFPYFDLLGHQVWGATAMILAELCWLLGVELSP